MEVEPPQPGALDLATERQDRTGQGAVEVRPLLDPHLFRHQPLEVDRHRLAEASGLPDQAARLQALADPEEGRRDLQATPAPAPPGRAAGTAARRRARPSRSARCGTRSGSVETPAGTTASVRWSPPGSGRAAGGELAWARRGATVRARVTPSPARGARSTKTDGCTDSSEGAPRTARRRSWR